MEVVAAAAADFLETSTAMTAVLLVVDGEVDETCDASDARKMPRIFRDCDREN